VCESDDGTNQERGDDADMQMLVGRRARKMIMACVL
jgi:hypothetical protein